jgi:alpha-D-ribose 1-methylphosphonate 5-triphosphate synthase subunit PhnG
VTAPREPTTPEERYEALAWADGDQLERIADRVLAGGAVVEVIAGPEAATTPLRLPVSGTTATAVVGHVALTTCSVLVDGVRGDGCRPGRDLRGALAAAVCDAETDRRGAQAVAIDKLARRARGARAEVSRARARAAALTSVDDGG